jgi:long-chain acyl-CoA synthetase
MIQVGGTLESSAHRTPNKIALSCGDVRMSYRDLDESTTALAKWFLAQGLQPGDRVAVHWTNSIPAVQLLYGLFKAGLIAVTINTRLKPAEIAFILQHSEARMCFSEPSVSPLAEEANAGCPILTQLPAVERVESREAALPSVSPDQPALIIYTSGTTALPKGVVHTHRSLYQTAIIAMRSFGEGRNASEEVVLPVLPLMHMGSLVVLLWCIYAGCSVTLLPRFEPGAVLDAIEKFRCTSLACMPALWHFIVEEQLRNPRSVSSLRSAWGAGDAVPVTLQNRFETAFAIPLQEAYGMTESAPLTTNPKDRIRSGSLGLPVDGVELRLVDFAGHDVPEGETGEILARSPGNCVGYWNDPEATRSALEEDGWLHTGDLASRDADGYYWFRGRKKEIVIRAGSNISPQEVEEALYRHTAVLEAGVVGQPDSIYGEIVVAFVVLRDGLKPDADELRQFAQKHLADYKVPERFVFVTELPKSPAGKVHRRELKRRLLPAAAAT